MKKHSFEIYNASAGSGKTYTLVKEYLKILLKSKQDDAYKNILAITFTNKAVEEMKSRVISTLEEFSKDAPDAKANTMLLDISSQTGMNPKEIQEKSKKIIKKIIHNYASFDISTIDKFTHRVIRSFALDLGLPLSFEVSLDTENLLAEAVDSVIAQAGEDENLTKLLVDFATEKADDDKSWDVTREFLEISKLLTNENNKTEISSLQDKTITQFLEIKKNILKICKDLENEIILIAQNALQKIDDKGIEHNSFFRSYVPNHLKKIGQKKEIVFNDTHYKRLEEGGERYAKSVSQSQKNLVDEIALDILEHLKNINQKAGTLFFYKAFLKNLTPLSVLNTVNQELINIQQEQNILSISEFNNIIHKEIREQPAPFIYEKLGDRYNHFFIDEFQDTSELQWKNLIPLIDNALSGQNDYGEKGSLMIVGDPKQSIYRWRGGKAEQLIELSGSENPFSNPDKNVENLTTNYRSFSEVIEFNNEFFGFLSDEFSDEDYRKIYAESQQKINSKIGGYVNISFINEEDLVENDEEVSEKNDLYLKSVIDTIHQARNQGFEYSEMVILVRRNTEGVLIANHLTENNIPIISSETLLISNASEVIFLINLLEFIRNKNNTQAKANFLYYLGRSLTENPIHDFLKKGIELYHEKEFENWLLGYGISFSFEEIRRKPLYEATEILVEVFLQNSNNIYVQSFLDLVLEQNIRSQSNIDDFLDFWKKDGHKKSIPSPKGNAVQIMTIHKSKGLEFPVVIFPFADQDYSRKKGNLWVENELESIDLPKVLVNNSSSVENYSEKAKETYYTKNQEELLDNINVIYVALTRAAEQLFIISKINFDANGEVQLRNSMSSFFIRFLKHKKVFENTKFNYSFGEPVRKSEKKKGEDVQKIIEPVSENFDARNIKIATLEALMWDTKQQESIEKGNLLHEILSMIHSDKDIDKTIDFSIEKGLITLDKKGEIKQTIESIIRHPQLKDFYNPEYKTLNERTIIRKGKPLVKPDKVVIKPTNEAMILDYKTGSRANHHKEQIESYAESLEEMNLKVTHKTLVYISENIEIVNL